MKEVCQVSSIGKKTLFFPISKMVEGINTRQLFVGLNVLILGALFYYFFRSSEHTYFLKLLGKNPQLKDILPPLLGKLGNSLPTFIHVFAFILMTAGVIGSNKKGYLIITLTWFAIDVLFELGQGFGYLIIPIIPDWFSDILFLENARDYFLHGRFDYLDLLAIAVGSLVAYIVLIKTKITGREAI